MCYARNAITQKDVENLEVDLGRAKSVLIKQQQQLLKDAAIATAAKEIKAEFENERNNIQGIIDFVVNGLDFLSGIGNWDKKEVAILWYPQATAGDMEVVGAFTYAVSALKRALEFWNNSRLVKIDEKEKAALEKNANSWNHLTFNNIEEVEEELAKRRKEREPKSAFSGEAALACGVVGSVCVAGIMFPPVGIAALAIVGTVSVIGGVTSFFSSS